MTQLANKFELHIPVEADEENAVDLLSAACELSKQRIKQVMKNGAVWLTHDEHTSRLRRAKRKLEKGDELHLYFDEAVQSAVPETPELIADEKDYSVFFKPQGMFSQGSKWGDHCTINRWVEQNMDRPAFVVHRLDRAATGLIIIAHTKTAAAALSKLFEQRSIDKKYRARVLGQFEPGTTVLDADIEDRKALSRVTLLQYDDVNSCSLLEVNIETGRKHQIRRHLAGAGFPIMGDRLYGSASDQTTEVKTSDDVETDDGNTDIAAETTVEQDELDLQLVATELAFVCPLSKTDVAPAKKNIWGSSKRNAEPNDAIESDPEVVVDKGSSEKTSSDEKTISEGKGSTKNIYMVPDRLLSPELRLPELLKSQKPESEEKTEPVRATPTEPEPEQTKPAIENSAEKSSKVGISTESNSAAKKPKSIWPTS